MMGINVRCPRRVSSAAGVVLVLLAGQLSYAQDPAVFQVKGPQENREYFSEMPFEHIDMLTGDLILQFTDLVLAGNAGRELRFQRTYDSHGAAPAQPSPVWWFGLAGMAMSVTEPVMPGDSTNIPTLEIEHMQQYSPTLIMADGSKRHTIFRDHPNGSSAAESAAARRWFVTPAFWRYDRVDNVLYMPDGTICQYDAQGRLAEFSDPFGNRVDLVWTPGQLAITQYFGNDQSRTVTIDRNDATGLPSRMTFAGNEWIYECESVGAFPCLWLRTVTPPAGPPWRYEYDLQHHRLDRIVTPHGGSLTFEWQTINFGTSPTEPFSSYTAITTRTASDGENPPVAWTYRYSPWHELPHVGIVVRPDGTVETFHHDVVGFGVLTGGMALISHTVAAPGSTDVLEGVGRAYRYLPVVRHMSAQGTIDYGSMAPRRVDVTRHNRVYRTEYQYNEADVNSFADYHRPRTIIESGERVRTIVRTYEHLTGPWVLGRVRTEVATVGTESFHKAWAYTSATRFLESQTIYGLTTTYTPDSRGNVQTVTKGTGRPTQYAYQWGEISEIRTPEYTVTREIDRMAPSRGSAGQDGRWNSTTTSCGG